MRPSFRCVLYAHAGFQSFISQPLRRILETSTSSPVSGVPVENDTSTTEFVPASNASLTVSDIAPSIEAMAHEPIVIPRALAMMTTSLPSTSAISTMTAGLPPSATRADSSSSMIEGASTDRTELESDAALTTVHS